MRQKIQCVYMYILGVNIELLLVARWCQKVMGRRHIFQPFILHHCTSERHFNRSQSLVNAVPSSILSVGISLEVLAVDAVSFISLVGVSFYKNENITLLFTSWEDRRNVLSEQTHSLFIKFVSSGSNILFCAILKRSRYYKIQELLIKWRILSK